MDIMNHFHGWLSFNYVRCNAYLKMMYSGVMFVMPLGSSLILVMSLITTHNTYDSTLDVTRMILSPRPSHVSVCNTEKLVVTRE